MNYLYSFTVILSYTHTKLTTFGCCHFFHMQFLLISFTFFCGRHSGSCWFQRCISQSVGKKTVFLRLRAWFDPPSAPFRPWPQHSQPNSGTDLPSWRCSLSQGVPRTGWSSPWIFRVGLPAEFSPKSDGDFSKNQAAKQKK